jgi:hypothetical protein
MSEAMKPCPFCSSAAVAETLDSRSAWAYCDNEECGVELWADTRAEAIAAWNRRTHADEQHEVER